MMAHQRSLTAPIQQRIDRAIDELIVSLPDPERLVPDERRGLIARYAAVLEGNFIYWMTAAHLAVASDEAKAIIEDNLREEVRDNHPGMLRRFALAAHAAPTDSDALAVYRNLEHVRLFVAELSAVKIVLMMAFFEGFITRFMPYLADLADRQGSAERQYTDVHGVVDVVHTEGLFRALEAEMLRKPDVPEPTPSLFTGVEVLRTLIENVIHPNRVTSQHVALGTTVTEPAAAAA
jgi:heme oxygenase-like protein